MTSSSPSPDFLKIMAATKPGDLVTCKRCNDQFERPFWFFEGLCDLCFHEFDTAKMLGRWDSGPSTESSNEWMQRPSVIDALRQEEAKTPEQREERKKVHQERMQARRVLGAKLVRLRTGVS